MEKEFTQAEHRSIDEADAAIDIRDFDLWYADFQALKSIDLQIPENRCCAFIGPSGCGKSTLLRTFNRMCDFVEGVRTEGSIEFCGQDIFKMDANALRVHVGMVFQHPNPFPMSIRDNILYGPARMKKLSRSEADEIVERLDRKSCWKKGTCTWDDGHVDGNSDHNPDELLIDSVRHDEVPGIHTISYDSEADCITISHSAHSRKGFALGAVLAAEFTQTHEGLLTTSDLFKF